MKNFTLLFALIFTVSVYSQIQLDEFKLSDYKLPDIKRHKLDVNFDLNGGIQLTDYFSEKSYYNSTTGRGVFMPAYSFYRNSRKYQGQQEARFNLDYYAGKWDNQQEFYDGNKYFQDHNSKSFQTGLDLFSENRFYMGDEISYFEVNFNSQIEYYSSSIESSTTGDINVLDFYQNSKHKSHLYKIEMPVLVGFGRVEQVQDSRHALFILNDLRKKGRLKRIPDVNEIIQLSEKISIVKNKRFFDSRLQKIDELDTVNGFLLEHDLLEKQDITYFSSLNDMWDFGGNPVRLSGIRGYFGLIPLFGYFNDHMDQVTEQNDLEEPSETREMNNALRILFIVGVDYYKPIKQKWQYNLDTKLGLGPASYKNENEIIPYITYDKKYCR